MRIKIAPNTGKLYLYFCRNWLSCKHYNSSVFLFLEQNLLNTKIVDLPFTFAKNRTNSDKVLLDINKSVKQWFIFSSVMVA